jgi:hypothetical protein
MMSLFVELRVEGISLVLVAILATAATSAPAGVLRLNLRPADVDHDGVISENEAASWMSSDPARLIIVEDPTELASIARAGQRSEPRPLNLPRRVGSISQFELPREELFYKDVKKRKK